MSCFKTWLSRSEVKRKIASDERRENETGRRAVQRPRLSFEELEARVLYSADPVAQQIAEMGEVRIVRAAQTQAPQETAAGKELVVIDARVSNAFIIASEILSNGQNRYEVLLLGETQDAFDTISQALENESSWAAVHILSHGTQAQVQLGANTIDEASLNANKNVIAEWGKKLSAEGDFLLYGCDLAQGSDGQRFVESLSAALRHDVAASTNKTNAQDTTLEARVGEINAGNVLQGNVLPWLEGDLATFTVTNTNDAGAGSLRQAVTNANATAGADTIAFSIAGGGVQTIFLSSALPSITEQVTIDGKTQTGYGSSPLIELDGVYAGAASAAFVVNSSAASTSIAGLSIINFSGAGIDVLASNVRIEDNYIGLAASDLSGSGQGKQGVVIQAGANDTVIKGNVISTNGLGSLTQIQISNATGTQIIGNKIGTDANGSIIVGGYYNVIELLNADNSKIGGTNATDGNTIASTYDTGINMDSQSTGNAILGNLIYGSFFSSIQLGSSGVPANDLLDADTGANDLQNHPVITSARRITSPFAGVRLFLTLSSEPSSYYRIEYFSVSASNGNVDDHGGAQTFLGFSNIATDALGNANFNQFFSPGVAAGMLVTATATKTNSTYSTFGSTSAFASNVVVQDLPGVLASSSGTTLSEFGAAQTISVRLRSAPTADVTIPVSISDGAEGSLNVSSLTFTASNWNVAQQVIVTGKDDWVVDGTKSLSVTLGASTSADSNYSGIAAQSFNFTNADNDVTNSIYVDTTSDVNDADTSSISALFNNRGADGKISLREAILASNNTPIVGTANNVLFNIPSALTNGEHLIELSSALPVITGSVFINGQSEPDYVSSPVIRIDGGSASVAIGFNVSAGNSTIRGLALSNFSDAAIRFSSDNNMLEESYLGLGTNGSTVYGGGAGVSIQGSNNTVGSTGRSNFFAGTSTGVLIHGSTSNNNTIAQNNFGTNASNSGLGIGTGIELKEGASGTIIQDNVIGNASTAAIYQHQITSGLTATSVRQNFIGTNRNATASLVNTQGIVVTSGTMQVGTSVSSNENKITNTAGTGIRAFEESGYSAPLVDIGFNAFYGNNGLAIDLNALGTDANDTLDADSGANDAINRPSITSSILNAGTLSFSVLMEGKANTSYSLLIYSSLSTDTEPSGFGEGRAAFMAVSVTTDSSGQGRYDYSGSAMGLAIGHYLTATATETMSSVGRTSEFSARTQIRAPNVAPTISGAAASITVLENTPALLVPSFTATDSENGLLSQMTVHITSGFSAVDDRLTWTEFGGVTGVFDSATGRLTLTGLASDATYTTIARSIYFDPGLTNNPSATARVIEVSVTDDEGLASGLVSISVSVVAVNDAPSLVAPATASVNEDTVLTFASGSLVVGDAEASTLQVSLSVGAGGLTLGTTTGLVFSVGDGTSDATMVFSGSVAQVNAALASLSYLGNVNANGSDALDVTVSDLGSSGTGGSLTASSSVAITVNPVNDAPSLVAPATASVNEDTVLTFAPGSLVVGDAEASTLQVSLSVGAGGLTLGTTTGLVFSVGDGTSDATMVFSGSVAQVNAALASLSYLGNVNANGSDALAITVSDLGASGSGGTLTASASVAITVNPVNDAPSLVAPATASVNEDTVLTFASGSLVVGDAEASTLQVSLSVGAGGLTLGTTTGLVFSVGDGTSDATMVFSGSVAQVNAALASLSYLGNVNANGSDALAITVSDLGASGSGGTLTASASVAITVNPVNDAPSLVLPSVALATAEDTLLMFTGATAIQVSDVDVSLGSLRVDLTVTQGTLSLGSLSGLSFVSGDGLTDTQMSFTGSVASINAALAGMAFLPDANFNGTANFSVTVNDLGGSGLGGPKGVSSRLAITVNAVNDPVLVASPSALSTPEDSIVLVRDANGAAFVLSDVDAGNLPMQVTISASAGSIRLQSLAGITVLGGSASNLLIQGTLSDLNAALAGLEITPPPDFFGTIDLSLVANDLGGEVNSGPASAVSATVRASISAVNDAPVVTVNSARFAVAQADLGQLVSEGIKITDVDDPQMRGAVVSLGSTYQSGRDRLYIDESLVDAASLARIGSTWDAQTGRLVLSGTASNAEYAATLSALRFITTGESNVARSVSIAVTDGSGSAGQAGVTGDVQIRIVVALPGVLLLNEEPPVVTTTQKPTPKPAEPVKEDVFGEAIALSLDRQRRAALNPEEDLDRRRKVVNTEESLKPAEVEALKIQALRTSVVRYEDNSLKLGGVQSLIIADAVERVSESVANSITSALRNKTKLPDVQEDRLVQSLAEESVAKEAAPFDITASQATSASVAMFATLLLWTLRAGGLVAAIATSSPGWRNMDPLPLLLNDGDERDKNDKLATANETLMANHGATMIQAHAVLDRVARGATTKYN